MQIRFSSRWFSLLTAWVLLFTVLPVDGSAEDEYEQQKAVMDLSVSIQTSVQHLFVGDGAVGITAEINGGTAPYEVTIQAVKNGDVVFAESRMTSGTTAAASFLPEHNGDYELVIVVCDAQHTQVLDAVTLMVAEHDAETEADWAASVDGAAVSGDWAASLVAVARTQLCYRESGKDFIVKSGGKQAYSRYGDWFGMPYADWNNAFLAFAAEYANIPADAFLSGASCRSWVNGMRTKGAYMEPGSYTPQAGDVAFLSSSRAAVVERVNGESVQVIEGDVNGEVVRKNYAISKLAGVGNTRLLMGLYRGTATAVPAAPEQTPADGKPAGTAAPTAKPTATPEPAEEEELAFSATPTPRPGMTAAPRDEADPLGHLIDTAGDAVAQLQAAATSVPTEFSEAFYLMQAEVRKVTERYLGAGAKTDAEIKAFADKLTLQEVYYLRVEMEALTAYADSIGLPAWENNAVWEREETSRKLFEAIEDRWLSLVQPRETQVLNVGNATFSVDDGDLVGTSDNSLTWTVVLRGNISSAKTWDYKLTITNNYDCEATLCFDWQAEGFQRFDGQSISKIGTSGSKQVDISAGETYDITVRSKAEANESKTSILTLTNITLTPEVQNGQCILQFDAERGSVAVNGEAAANGSEWTVDAAAGLSLTAKAKEGYRFLGWVDQADGAVLSSEESFALQSGGEVTVTAVFAKEGEEIWFGVADLGSSGDLASSRTSHVNARCFYLTIWRRRLPVLRPAGIHILCC